MPKTETRSASLTSENVNTGLTPDERGEVVDALNIFLADEFLLYTKTRKYHWNVVGSRFHQLHLFFEEQYEQLDEIIDEVAENVRQFGGIPFGTMAEFIKKSRLKEDPGDNPDADMMIVNLLHDHESIARQLRDDIERADEEFGAPEAAEFLTSLLEQHNKMAWMLRSHTVKHL